MIKQSRIERAKEELIDVTGVSVTDIAMRAALEHVGTIRMRPIIEFLIEYLGNELANANNNFDRENLSTILRIFRATFTRISCSYTSEIYAHAMNDVINDVQESVNFWLYQCGYHESRAKAQISTLTNFIYQDWIWKDGCEIVGARV